MPRLSFRSIPRNLALAIFLLFALLVLTFSVIFVQINVPEYMVINQFRIGYNIATTLVTTVLANYIRGEIQRQWLRYINHEISDVRYQISHDRSIGPRWRAVLGINTIEERFRNISSTGLAQVSFIATGLLVTSVVTAVTLQEVGCSAVVEAPRIHSGADSGCARSVPNQNVERTSPLWEYRTFWPRADGSAYFATTNLGCPSWSGAQFLGSINRADPDQFAYVRNGVAIDRSAIGAPEIFYTQFPAPNQPGDTGFGHHIQPTSLRTVSQCLPVMTSNPIKCTPGGTLTSSGKTDGNGSYHEMSINAGGCQFDQMSYEDPKSPFGVMISRLCTSNSTSNNTVGQGTIAMGATNIMSLTLAAAMGDTSYLKQNADKYTSMTKGDINNLTYSLSCTIDVAPTLQWRTLDLNLGNSTFSNTASYSKRVSASEGCRNVGSSISASAWALGDGYAGGAVAALVPSLSEGRYWNGFSNTILNQALNVTDTSNRYADFSAWENLIRHAPYGFYESTNALEDVLGLTTGITVSQMSTLDSQAPGSPLADSKHFSAPVRGQATFSCTRVGPGQRYAIIFCLPSTVALIMAVYLLWVTPPSKTAYKTSRLEDLIAIGMASERELNAAYKADHLDDDGMASSLVGGAQGFGMRRWPSDRSVESGFGSRSETPVGWDHGLWPPPAPTSKGSGTVKTRDMDT